MPVYINRTIDQFPTEFYRCYANPEGHEFRCPFCEDFFKTKAGRNSHMKRCSIEETGEEIDEEYELGDGITVGDYLQSLEIYANVIRHYIKSRELEALSNETTEYIQTHIKNKLISSGYITDSIHMRTFLIYKYFFETTDEDWRTATDIWKNAFCEKYDWNDFKKKNENYEL